MSCTAKRIAACIPTYNQAEYLAQAVESCLKQTRPVDVVYVSDDASTDHTPRVMEELVARDSRVRYIRQPKNLGIAMNSDWVMRNAEADYLVRLDSDDFIHERFVEVLSDALDAHPRGVAARVLAGAADGRFRRAAGAHRVAQCRARRRAHGVG